MVFRSGGTASSTLLLLVYSTVGRAETMQDDGPIHPDRVWAAVRPTAAVGRVGSSGARVAVTREIVIRKTANRAPQDMPPDRSACEARR